MSAANVTIFTEPFEWYMIRNGYLGPEYSSKVVSIVLGLIMLIYDGITRKRFDYLWCMIVGTILWIVLEWCLLQSGVREYQEGYLGGKLLGFWPALILRCAQECGFLMVCTLFEGDRLMNCMKGKKDAPKSWRRYLELAVVFLFMTISSSFNMKGGAKEERWVGSNDVCGRRNMTHIVSVILFLITTIVPIILLIVFRNKKYFVRRTIGMTIFVTWISGLGMILEYNFNARWVEVGYYPQYVALPSSGHMFLAFVYDLVIEVVAPPVFIYHLMVLCFILPDLKNDDYYEQKKELPISQAPPVQPSVPVFNGPQDLFLVCSENGNLAQFTIQWTLDSITSSTTSMNSIQPFLSIRLTGILFGMNLWDQTTVLQ